MGKFWSCLARATLIATSLYCLFAIRELRQIEVNSNNVMDQGNFFPSTYGKDDLHGSSNRIIDDPALKDDINRPLPSTFSVDVTTALQPRDNNGVTYLTAATTTTTTANPAEDMERLLKAVASPEVRFPCGQIWFLMTFLASITASVVHLSSTPGSTAHLYPMLYATWVTCGVGLPGLAAEFFYCYGMPKFARPFLIALAPPLLFYQAPKYFHLVDEYNDVLIVSSIYSLAILAIFMGNGSLLVASFLLATSIFGLGIDRFPKRGSHFVMLSAANLFILRALQMTL